MKEELLDRVIHLNESLKETIKVWNRLDWSVVPEEVGENYPFHQDFTQMQEGLERWIEIIRKS